MVEYQPLTFNRWYVYPAWAYGLGWLMVLSSILLVPLWALSRLWRANGNFRQVRMNTHVNFVDFLPYMLLTTWIFHFADALKVQAT